jgi:ABC-type polysaccharide/polyol phosphate transport system ATPase subunit
MNGDILDLRREEMQEQLDEIAAFADIGGFTDHIVMLLAGMPTGVSGQQLRELRINTGSHP